MDYNFTGYSILEDWSLKYTGWFLTLLGAPFERIKILKQVHLNQFGARHHYQTIRSTEGFRGLFKGALAPLITFYAILGLRDSEFVITPGKLLIKDLHNPEESMRVRLYKAIAVYMAALHPLAVIRTNLAADSSLTGKIRYNGFFDCAKKLYIQENGLGVFYRGITPILLLSMIGTELMFLNHRNNWLNFNFESTLVTKENGKQETKDLSNTIIGENEWVPVYIVAVVLYFLDVLAVRKMYVPRKPNLLDFKDEHGNMRWLFSDFKYSANRAGLRGLYAGFGVGIVGTCALAMSKNILDFGMEEIIK